MGRLLKPTPDRALATVVGLYLVLALLVATLLPPWEANDEADHVMNVQTLVRGEAYRIPLPTADEPHPAFAGTEAHQPPLYYLALAGWQQALDLPPRTPMAPRRPVDPRSGPPRASIFLHETRQDGADQRRVTLLRLPSVLFGGLAVGLTAAAARRFARDPWTPVVAAAIVAFNPRFVFLSGVVNNDNLVDLLGALGTLLAVLAVTQVNGEPRRRLLIAAGLGATAGLLLVTKLTAAPLVVGLILAGLLAGQSAHERLQLGVLMLTAMLAISGWWFVRNQDWYGDPVARTATHEYLGGIVSPPDNVFHQLAVEAPKGAWSSFWYTSGGNRFTWDWWVYVPFWLLTAVGLSGVLAGYRRRTLAVAERRALIVLAVLSCGGLAAIGVVAADTPQTQARVAFGALPAIACMIAFGFELLRAPVLLRATLPLLGLVGTVVAVRSDLVGIYY